MWGRTDRAVQPRAADGLLRVARGGPLMSGCRCVAPTLPLGGHRHPMRRGPDLSQGRRIARLVLVACEAFDNFPPPAARPMATLARVPGGVWLFSRLMQIGWFRRAEFSYGGMAVTSIPDDVVLDWFAPLLRDRRIHRDFAKFAPSAPDRGTLLRWSEQLRAFAHPVLVVRADQDRLMPQSTAVG